MLARGDEGTSERRAEASESEVLERSIDAKDKDQGCRFTVLRTATAAAALCHCGTAQPGAELKQPISTCMLCLCILQNTCPH